MNNRRSTTIQHIRLGERGMLGIPQHQVLEFLLRFDTSRPLPKKVHELLIGYICAQFLEERLRESAIIGFPAAEGWEKLCPDSSLTLDWLLEHHHNIVNDTDTDIQISSGGIKTKYQITRFVNAPGGTAHRRLAELIAKKCKHQQPDKFLHLIVSLENAPNITEKEIHELLKTPSIPFCAISLIGKASTERGHFFVCEL